jgi:hypothetical protein
MALRKTEEERQAKDRARTQEAFEKSPIGQARAAYARGDAFFQVEIPHSAVKGQTVFGAALTRQTHATGGTDILGLIEAEGWRLEHAGFVYVMTGQTSRDKFLASGQQTAVMGEVSGIYLFRRLAPSR